jgi:hypothetical protein
VQVKADSGDIRIEHAHDVEVQSGSGDVSVGTAEGSATLAAGSSDVTIRAITGPGRVSTGSGDIRVERATARCGQTRAPGTCSWRRAPPHDEGDAVTHHAAPNRPPSSARYADVLRG